MDIEPLRRSLSEAEEDGQWYGHAPCVCHCNGGCDRHNPTHSLIYYEPRVVIQKKEGLWAHKYGPALPIIYRYISRVWNTLCCKQALKAARAPLVLDVSGRTPGPLSIYRIELPTDSQSFEPLPVIHPALPYRLAFYHLDCVRRQLGPTFGSVFVPELSCRGTFRFPDDGPRHTWSSEVYLENGIFLQKQELSYSFNRETRCQKVELRACPHVSLTISKPKYRKSADNDFDMACANLRHEPKRGWRFWGERWCSTDRYADITICKECHSDAVTNIEQIDHQVKVRYTCYRKLGPAIDRFDPNWLALNGSRLVRPTQHARVDSTLFIRILQIANSLGRPDLHLAPGTTQDPQPLAVNRDGNRRGARREPFHGRPIPFNEENTTGRHGKKKDSRKVL